MCPIYKKGNALECETSNDYQKSLCVCMLPSDAVTEQATYRDFFRKGCLLSFCVLFCQKHVTYFLSTSS